MSRRNIRATAIRVRLGKRGPRLQLFTAFVAAVAPEVAKLTAAADRLVAEGAALRAAGRQEHPHDADQRARDLQALREQLRILQHGATNSWEAAALRTFTQRAGIDADMSFGLLRSQREIAALETEIADLRAELAALDASDPTSATTDATA